MELNNDRNAGRSILSAYFKACVACSPTMVVVASSPTMVVVQHRFVQYIEYHLYVYNVKRLAVGKSYVYTLCITLCIISMYTM